jgi:hypothetical protein
VIVDPFYATTYDCSSSSGRILVLGGGLPGKQRYAASAEIILVNVAIAAFVPPSVFYASMDGNSGRVVIWRRNQLADDHRVYYPRGAQLSNAVTRHTPSGLSWQHLPSGGAAVWFRPNMPYEAAVIANIAVTLSAWVYRDAAYNGAAEPRIVCLGGILQGVPADVIGDSHTGALAWELLEVTVTPTETGMLQFVVEGQGTVGSFYTDDIGAL